MILSVFTIYGHGGHDAEPFSQIRQEAQSGENWSSYFKEEDV